MRTLEERQAGAAAAVPGSGDTAWTMAPDVRADLAADATVLLDLRRGQCYALNPLGACIWRLLSEAAGGLTDAALVSALRPLVSGAPPDFASEVQAFRVNLARKGLIRPAGPNARAGTTSDFGASRLTMPPLLRRVRRSSLQFAAAFSLLLASDVVMRVAGVRGLRAFVARVRPRDQATGADSLESAKALVHVVNRAAACYYKHAWCLHRAVATSCFLRLNGIASTVCIGFHPMPFYGHAWVEVNDTIVDDRVAARTRYRVLERF